MLILRILLFCCQNKIILGRIKIIIFNYFLIPQFDQAKRKNSHVILVYHHDKVKTKIYPCDHMDNHRFSLLFLTVHQDKRALI